LKLDIEYQQWSMHLDQEVWSRSLPVLDDP